MSKQQRSEEPSINDIDEDADAEISSGAEDDMPELVERSAVEPKEATVAPEEKLAARAQRAASASTFKDPRRPGMFRPYQRLEYDPDDAPVSWSCTLALLVGMASMMLANKYLAWLGCFIVTYYLVGMRPSQMDGRQLMTAAALCFTGAITGTINSYRFLASQSENAGGIPPVTQEELEKILNSQ